MKIDRDPFNYQVPVSDFEHDMYKSLLNNWKEFQGKINSMSEISLKKALLFELNTRCRRTMLVRIKGRLNKLVSQREHKVLSKFFNETT